MNRPIKFRAWDVFCNKLVFHGAGLEDIEAFWRMVKHGQESGREVPVMQFTGLTDSNGVEIYEGDVLSPSNNVVKFENGCFVQVSMNSVMHDEIYQSCEVIGNIYENPELIKE